MLKMKNLEICKEQCQRQTLVRELTKIRNIKVIKRQKIEMGEKYSKKR